MLPCNCQAAWDYSRGTGATPGASRTTCSGLSIRFENAGKVPLLAKHPAALPLDDPIDAAVQEYNLVIEQLAVDPSNGVPVAPPDLYNYFRAHTDTHYEDCKLNLNGLGYQGYRSVPAPGDRTISASLAPPRPASCRPHTAFVNGRTTVATIDNRSSSRSQPEEPERLLMAHVSVVQRLLTAVKRIIVLCRVHRVRGAHCVGADDFAGGLDAALGGQPGDGGLRLRGSQRVRRQRRTMWATRWSSAPPPPHEIQILGAV